ncbi:hypothetical protein M3Y94_00514500 [Aphelenchoides besseyi]|nr:hypothetical protein M3Y94_00514500 [Aphelenchoides besseyi]
MLTNDAPNAANENPNDHKDVVWICVGVGSAVLVVFLLNVAGVYYDWHPKRLSFLGHMFTLITAFGIAFVVWAEFRITKYGNALNCYGNWDDWHPKTLAILAHLFTLCTAFAAGTVLFFENRINRKEAAKLKLMMDSVKHRRNAVIEDQTMTNRAIKRSSSTRD